MKKYWILVFLFFYSCIDTQSVLKLNKNGSGVLIQKMKLHNPEANFKNVSEDIMRNQAAKIGEGVTLKEFRIVNDHEIERVYEFTDINKISLAPGIFTGIDSATGDPISFQFKQGNNSELNILLPPEQQTQKKKNTTNGKKNKLIDEEKPGKQIEKMVTENFKNLNLSLQIEVENKILKTNSSFIENENRITLFHFDFIKLFQDEKKVKRMFKENSNFMNFRSIKGFEELKSEEKKEITVTF